METSLYITRYNSDNVTLNNNYNANKNNNDKRQQLQKQVTSVSLEIKVDVTIFEAAIPDLFFFYVFPVLIRCTPAKSTKSVMVMAITKKT